MDSRTFVPAPTVRWLRFARRADLARWMGAAVEVTLVRSGGLSSARARALRDAALRRFAGLLAARARRVRALTKDECRSELEREHGALLRQRLESSLELAGLERELGQARRAETAPVLLPAEEALLAQALAGDLRMLVRAEDGARALAIVVEREAARRAKALGGVLARERARIDVLERRLAKLRNEQERLEASFADLARRAELDPGLPSIYRTAQGLPDEEPEREVKRAMLRRIYEQNLRLQQSA